MPLLKVSTSSPLQHEYLGNLSRVQRARNLNYHYLRALPQNHQLSVARISVFAFCALTLAAPAVSAKSPPRFSRQVPEPSLRNFFHDNFSNIPDSRRGNCSVASMCFVRDSTRPIFNLEAEMEYRCSLQNRTRCADRSNGILIPSDGESYFFKTLSGHLPPPEVVPGEGCLYTTREPSPLVDCDPLGEPITYPSSVPTPSTLETTSTQPTSQAVAQEPPGTNVTTPQVRLFPKMPPRVVPGSSLRALMEDHFDTDLSPKDRNCSIASICWSRDLGEFAGGQYTMKVDTLYNCELEDGSQCAERGGSVLMPEESVRPFYRAVLKNIPSLESLQSEGCLQADDQAPGLVECPLVEGSSTSPSSISTSPLPSIPETPEPDVTTPQEGLPPKTAATKVPGPSLRTFVQNRFGAVLDPEDRNCSVASACWSRDLGGFAGGNYAMKVDARYNCDMEDGSQCAEKGGSVLLPEEGVKPLYREIARTIPSLESVPEEGCLEADDQEPGLVECAPITFEADDDIDGDDYVDGPDDYDDGAGDDIDGPGGGGTGGGPGFPGVPLPIPVPVPIPVPIPGGPVPAPVPGGGIPIPKIPGMGGIGGVGGKIPKPGIKPKPRPKPSKGNKKPDGDLDLPDCGGLGGSGSTKGIGKLLKRTARQCNFLKKLPLTCAIGDALKAIGPIINTLNNTAADLQRALPELREMAGNYTEAIENLQEDLRNFTDWRAQFETFEQRAENLTLSAEEALAQLSALGSQLPRIVEGIYNSSLEIRGRFMQFAETAVYTRLVAPVISIVVALGSSAIALYQSRQVSRLRRALKNKQGLAALKAQKSKGKRSNSSDSARRPLLTGSSGSAPRASSSMA